MSQSLELFPIGNCAASALIDEAGRYVWACAPRVDGDPFFSNLLAGEAADPEAAQGFWSVEVEGLAQTRAGLSAQHPESCKTELTDRGRRASLEIMRLLLRPATGSSGGSTARWPSCVWCGRWPGPRASACGCGPR